MVFKFGKLENASMVIDETNALVSIVANGLEGSIHGYLGKKLQTLFTDEAYNLVEKLAVESLLMETVVDGQIEMLRNGNVLNYDVSVEHNMGHMNIDIQRDQNQSIDYELSMYGEVLFNISQNIAGDKNHREFLKTTFDLISSSMALSGVYLVVDKKIRNEVEYVEHRASRYCYATIEKTDLSQCLHDWYTSIPKSKEVYICSDVNELNWKDTVSEFKIRNIGAFIMAPIYHNQKKQGLMLFAKDRKYGWNKSEKNMLQAICLLMNLEICNETANKKLSSETEKLDYLSKHDEMTGLYNRNYLEMNFKSLDYDKNYPLAVIMGDLNGLKLTNDAYGHEAGDAMLYDSGRLIQSIVKDGGLAGRWGGDEFLILLPNTNEKEANNICNRIKSSFDQSDTNLSFNSISLGYAIRNNTDKTLVKTIKEAEDYMYKKKLMESKSLRSSVINSIQQTLHEKSYETEAHALRMCSLSICIGLELGLSSKELADLELFAMLHDIGKIAVSNEILDKAKALTDKEWGIMKGHSESGYRILKAIPELSHIAEYVLSHHERWDGKGYPEEKVGKDIPLLSRIISVVDTYDAMTNDRVYRKAIDKITAINEIKKNSGSQFDPIIVDVFNKIIANCIEINE